MPSWRLGADDFNQAVEWLVQLGYLARSSRSDKDLIASATRRFQEAHPQLDNDGILGRATLDQLQRVSTSKPNPPREPQPQVPARYAGAADLATLTPGYGDWILYGSVAVLVVGGIWLAWRYRDELSIALIANTDQGRIIDRVLSATFVIAAGRSLIVAVSASPRILSLLADKGRAVVSWSLGFVSG
jgi:hypothetical protein